MEHGHAPTGPNLHPRVPLQEKLANQLFQPVTPPTPEIDGATLDAHVRQFARSTMPNVNVFTADEDPRNAKNAPPNVGSDRQADVGNKPKRQTRRGEPYSDWAYQSIFQRLTPNDLPAGLSIKPGMDHLDREGRPHHERQVARFVIDLVQKGHIKDQVPNEEALAEALRLSELDRLKRENKQKIKDNHVRRAVEMALTDAPTLTRSQRRAVDRFDKALSQSSKNYNTVTATRVGSGPRVLRSPGDSVVPSEVQRRVQILPETRRDNWVAKKAAKIESHRMHGRAVKSTTSAIKDPTSDRLKETPGLAKGIRKRQEKNAWASKHMHHGEHHHEHLAFKPVKRLAKRSRELLEAFNLDSTTDHHAVVSHSVDGRTLPERISESNHDKRLKALEGINPDKVRVELPLTNTSGDNIKVISAKILNSRDGRPERLTGKVSREFKVQFMQNGTLVEAWVSEDNILKNNMPENPDVVARDPALERSIRATESERLGALSGNLKINVGGEVFKNAVIVASGTAKSAKTGENIRAYIVEYTDAAGVKQTKQVSEARLSAWNAEETDD